MDPTLSTVIIALMTGIFSVITVKIQKNQSKLIEKIDEQTIFIEKEKAIRQKLVQAEKKRDAIIEQATLLSMKINIHLINSISEIDQKIRDDLKSTSKELETEYKESLSVIRDISKEYDLIIQVSADLQREFERLANRRTTTPDG